jgi:hypothetical protein
MVIPVRIGAFRSAAHIGPAFAAVPARFVDRPKISLTDPRDDAANCGWAAMNGRKNRSSTL